MIVIFDVEGTLVDCAAANLRCWQETLHEAGLKAPIDVLQLYLGMDGNEMLQIVLPRLDHAARTRLIKREGEMYKERYLHKTKAFAHVSQLIETLKNAGAKIALATDSDAEELSLYQKLMNIEDLIDAVSCGDDVKIGKPHSGLIKNALGKLGAKVEEAIMVGDTPYDAEAARGAGVVAIGVLTGGFSKEILQASGCSEVAPDLADLGKIIERQF
jgi:HAD superfamily hydrolase (TIGR01549 family)